MASQSLQPFASFVVFVLVWCLHLASAQTSNSSSTTYNTTITWYGTNDKNGSPNCNSNTVACGFYTYPGYAAAVSQNLFGVAANQGPGPACGTCYRVTIQTDENGSAVPNAGSSIVVMVNNLCPSTPDDPLCSQASLNSSSTNSLGDEVTFNLCNDDGAHAALLTPAGTGLARGTAVMVSCDGEWEGEKKTDCGSLCEQGQGQGLGAAGKGVASIGMGDMLMVLLVVMIGMQMM